MEYLLQEHSVEFSGYVRGYKTVKVYYCPETKKVLDWESIGKLNVVRDDTESYEIPKFDKSETFKNIIE